MAPSKLSTHKLDCLSPCPNRAQPAPTPCAHWHQTNSNVLGHRRRAAAAKERDRLLGRLQAPAPGRSQHRGRSRGADRPFRHAAHAQGSNDPHRHARKRSQNRRGGCRQVSSAFDAFVWCGCVDSYVEKFETFTLTGSWTSAHKRTSLRNTAGQLTTRFELSSSTARCCQRFFSHPSPPPVLRNASLQYCIHTPASSEFCSAP